MLQKTIKDYLVMDNGKDITIACESELLIGINIEEIDFAIDQKSVKEKHFILIDRSKKNAIKFINFEISHLKKINERSVVYLIKLQADRIEKSFKIEKIK